jgi:enoyl-CoA hydratase/carnithine racemase
MAIRPSIERGHRPLGRAPVPVIASINGLAFGGGIELITASDMRLCLASAMFALPEVKLGIIPGGSIVRLNRMGLERVAVKLAFSGDPITAQEALWLGLVDQVCSNEEDLRSRTLETADRVSRNAPLALRAAKKLLRGSMTAFTAAAMQLAMEVRGPLETTEDSKEGLAAFAAKRPPNFVGR